LKGFLTKMGKGRRRLLNNKTAVIFSFAAIMITLYQLYSILYSHPTLIVYRAIHVGFFLAAGILLFTNHSKKGKTDTIPWYDLIMIVAAIGIAVFMILNEQHLLYRRAFLDEIMPLEIFFGCLLILLVLDGTRRTLGWPLVIVAGAFILYALFGNYVPGIFGHRGVSVSRLVETLFLTTSGIFGMPVGVASTYAFMFILFGSLLKTSGGGDFFYEISEKIAGKSRGGIAKTAVVSSAFFGSISGSPIANVATTGSITIPMMKKAGYPPAFAGAVETAASCGGTIMPPVMGAVAFVLAEVIGTTYFEVMKAAIFPAILYFGAIFMAVDNAAARMNLSGITSEQKTPTGKILIKGLHFIIPLFFLIFRLYQGLTATRVAFEALIMILIFAFIRTALEKEYKFNFAKIRETIEDAVKSTVTIAVACSAAGITVGVISLTGVGTKFTSLILSFSQGFLLPALLLTALVTIILGMGMPITPTYILAASLAAPALVKVGVAPIAANMFIVYYAAICTMTPPVAVTAFTAATIADANPMEVGFRAVRLAAIAYIIPFIFIYQPELLLVGDISNIIITFVVVGLGTFTLVCVIDNYLIRKNTLKERVLLGLSTVCLLFPFPPTSFLGTIASIAGIALVVWIIMIQRGQKSGYFNTSGQSDES